MGNPVTLGAWWLPDCRNCGVPLRPQRRTQFHHATVLVGRRRHLRGFGDKVGVVLAGHGK